VANVTITIPNALIVMYGEAATRRLARLPAQPLPGASPLFLQGFVVDLMRGLIRGELAVRAAAGADVDAELIALEAL
jgi:hypothetical protein